MNCPSCGKNVKPGTSICPFCDAIVDDSFLGDLSAVGGDDDDTPVPDAPPQFEQRPARPARPPRPARAAGGGAAAARAAAPRPVRRRAPVRPAPVPLDEPEPEAPPQKAGPGGYVNKYSQYWEEDEEPTPAPSRNSAPRPSLSAVDGKDEPPETMSSEELDPTLYFKNAWAWFQQLHFEDKLVTSSSAALAFFSMWPWTTGQYGDTLGIVTWGFVTLLLAASAVGSVWGRGNPRFETVPQHLFPKVTICLGALAALICAIFAITARTTETIGFGPRPEVVTVASAASGVYLSLLASCVVAVGGFLTMKRERNG